MVLVGLERDLVSDIGVEASASLGCNKAMANRGHPVLPIVPGVGELLFAETESSFFSNETTMAINVSEQPWIVQFSEAEVDGVHVVMSE